MMLQAIHRDTKPLRESDSDIARIYKGPWVKSEWFCMECGKQDVWQLADQGDDYYIGHSARCHSCEHEMSCLDKVGGSAGSLV